MPEKISVLFRVAARGVGRRDLSVFARRLQSEVTNGRAFDCLIASDLELRRLNRDFRRKDYAADVLSFPAGAAAGAHFLGEIAISFDRAKAQAAERGHAAADELRVLMLHGALHLLGMDHERDGGRMQRAEREWRKRFGLPHGLIERGLIERRRMERARP